jgi:hypothetical protein
MSPLLRIKKGVIPNYCGSEIRNDPLLCAGSLLYASFLCVLKVRAAGLEGMIVGLVFSS